MTEPPTSDTSSADRGAADREIRDLLAGLPGPGRMPPQVASRIDAALAHEQQVRAAEAPTGTLSTQVGVGPAESPHTSPRRGGNVVDLAPRRSRRGLRTTAIAAAAAALLLVGGLGYAGLLTDNATSVAAPVVASNLASRVSVSSTGRNYSRNGLPTQASALLRTPRTTTLPPQVMQQYGDMATSRGVVACLGSLRSALAADPDRITVDLARYAGVPAVVVVLTTAGKSTAWVVSRTCSQTSTPLAGPAAVAT